MTLLQDYVRVDRLRPCPVCGKPDWCLISVEGGDSPMAALCQRIQSEHRFRGAGWFHLLRPDGRPRSPFRTSWLNLRAPTATDFGRMGRRFQDQVRADQLVSFAAQMGVKPNTLRTLGIGAITQVQLSKLGLWPAAMAWSFPMREAGGIVIGIRIRYPDGLKRAVTGSRVGMFFGLGSLREDQQLLVSEGESDCAALLDLGFNAVGRPGCRVGRDHLIDLIRSLRSTEVVVVSDNDEPGKDGAQDLARSLLAHAPVVRIIQPPPELQDIRDWRRAGASAVDVEETIRRASPMRISAVVQRVGGGS